MSGFLGLMMLRMLRVKDVYLECQGVRLSKYFRRSNSSRIEDKALQVFLDHMKETRWTLPQPKGLRPAQGGVRSSENEGHFLPPCLMLMMPTWFGDVVRLMGWLMLLCVLAWATAAPEQGV